MNLESFWINQVKQHGPETIDEEGWHWCLKEYDGHMVGIGVSPDFKHLAYQNATTQKGILV